MALNMLYKSILETIIDNIDAGIHVVDHEGKTIFYNRVMGELEGLEIEEVMGKSILEIFPSLNEDTSTLLTVMKSRKAIYNKNQSYLNSHGKQINTVNSTIPFKISPDKYGAVEIAKDVTKVKELSEKVQILQQVLAGRDPNKEEIKGYTFKSIIGEEDDFLNIVSLAKTAAKSSSTVLIYGETGTGKELFAQSIHYESNRCNKPFIAQNCAAIPESLLEGILFGTVKGSYTGAVNRPGLFEQAHGGTILLDEINSMGLQLQAKLLRVLQEGYIRRVGGLNDIPCDVRIIATTNEEPQKSVASGALRKDLYYRLNVIYLRIPPLRERKSDIPLLAEYFIKKFNTILNKDVWDISNEVKNAFMRYDWPGNVRELENSIEGAMNMVTKDHILKPQHFSNMKEIFDNRRNDNNYRVLIHEGMSLDEIIENVEKELIIEALKECSFNITKSANKLGIKRQNLQHKIKKYKIRIED
ncbi:sigma-54 interaction domain-containing protein [Lutispora thermophila]|uniref:Arginine utilization regulatory protein n=1 Tax=Lutispora thermophila DSM 19022 TaxID=1122184 RepID=A0A1M6HNF0_9FIRM|nr:sigma 54-interacting transcriptional regulator [Lutispora thermophila]SHJ23636.1 arginine utilization regulatory protein [Lutispora thermophila DSM 19022]